MSLVTRCPDCGTAFRVQRAQLAARGGSVRCGKCGGVFNGVAALVEDSDARLAFAPSPERAHFDVDVPAAGSVSHGDSPAAEFLTEPPRRATARWAWALAALFAALVMAAQMAYRFRAEIAATYPQTGTTLRAICESIGCDVPLPRRPDLMSIDSSDLQADSRREGLIVLNAVIRNRARFAQEFPALELTLTDEGDRPVVRRVLRPLEYLEPARRDDMLRQGIAAGGEAPLRIYLDTSRARAVGYRLYLFYPL